MVGVMGYGFTGREERSNKKSVEEISRQRRRMDGGESFC